MRRRQQQQEILPNGWRQINWRKLWRKITTSNNRINLLILLLFVALLPPFFFHFRLSRFHQMQKKNCGWLESPPLVCAHGGDSINAFPNTMAAYRSALRARVDCIEIDVSRSSDGVLFALHDRDLQRLSGNHTARVGLWSEKENHIYRHVAHIVVDLGKVGGGLFVYTVIINELDAALHFPGVLDDQKVPTVEDALMLVSNSVRRVILDAKIGPPLYEKGLAEDIVAVVNKSKCLNCVIWAKSDYLVREVTRLSPRTTVGYIIMKDPLTGSRSNVLRMKRAEVAGVYHPLIDEKLVQTLHGRNKKVFAWTVDDMVSMRDMLSNNVDAVVTSNPALFQQLMDDSRIQCLEDGFSLP